MGGLPLVVAVRTTRRLPDGAERSLFVPHRALLGAQDWDIPLWANVFCWRGFVLPRVARVCLYRLHNVIGVCRIRRSAREGEAPLTGDETTGASGRGEQVERVFRGFVPIGT